jgi:hypothetical protein
MKRSSEWHWEKEISAIFTLFVCTTSGITLLNLQTKAMSEEPTPMNQRKRKLDFVPDVENKRRRSDEAKSQTMKQHRQSSSNTIDKYDESDSGDDPSESELSSDTETSSDSGISSSDSDDEEEHDDEDSEHDSSIGDDSNMISLPTQLRPVISTSAALSGSSDLQSRISTFLPQLRKANEDLKTTEDDHRIDAVADDQDHYIEMDLGLGVLKEKPKPRPLNREIQTRESSSSSSSSSSSVSSSDGDSETDGPGQDAMRDLLGKKEKGKWQGRPVIQPLDEM